MSAGREAAEAPAPPAPASEVSVGAATPAEVAAAIEELGALFADAVTSGATINFVLPYTPADGVAWWRNRMTEVEAGTILPVLARLDGRIVGTTLLVLSRLPNSPHRAEIVKVIVHTSVRRRGIAARMMAEAEAVARAAGRWLLVLDTMEGTAAEAFYRHLGWHEAGRIPDHSVNPHGVIAPTVFFWKDLRQGPRA